jgi:hypothetical protein
MGDIIYNILVILCVLFFAAMTLALLAFSNGFFDFKSGVIITLMFLAIGTTVILGSKDSNRPNYIPSGTVSKDSIAVNSSIGCEFESVTFTGYAVGNPALLYYALDGEAEGVSPIQSGNVGESSSWYVYPVTIPVSGNGAGCGVQFENLSANCVVNISSPAKNGGNKYILNAVADFNNGVSESFGIAGGKVRFSGLQYGRSYVFDGKSLTVNEDGTADGEFTVPDYGYIDGSFPDLYSVRLVRAEGNSLETELILYVKRPIKRSWDARAGK